MALDPVDRFTGVDELLERQNQLLATALDVDGTSTFGESRLDQTPFGYISFPYDRARIGIPVGKTTLDFANGRVENDSFGVVDTDLSTITDISRNFDATANQLRSLYIYSDADMLLTMDGGETHTITGGNYYSFPSQGFTELGLETAGEPASISLVASTRSDPANVGSVSGSLVRVGGRPASTADSYTFTKLTTPDLEARHNLVDTVCTRDGVRTQGYATKTFMLSNDSGNGNSIDYAIQYNENPDGSKFSGWHTLDELTVGDGNLQHVNVTEPHHKMRVQYKASTAGATIEPTLGLTAHTE